MVLLSFPKDSLEKGMATHSTVLAWKIPWMEEPGRLLSIPFQLESESESVSCSVLFVSLALHGLKPSRLLCPWNSSGKNTGVGSHSLLQGIFPDPGIKPGSPALQADSLPFEPSGRPNLGREGCYFQNMGLLGTFPVVQWLRLHAAKCRGHRFNPWSGD